LQFLKAVGEGGSKIYGGFGISNGEQARALADSVEAIVAGSVFVRLITENQNNPDALYKAVRAKAQELTTG
jgi:tryptophan synthase alpha chain